MNYLHTIQMDLSYLLLQGRIILSVVINNNVKYFRIDRSIV